METGPWVHAPRLPLGAAYFGSCHAHPGEVFSPPAAQQEEQCNCGYARGVCERFPPDAPADAVRFSLSRDSNIIYILEKDHSPVEFGTLGLSELHSNPIVATQARMFVANHRALPSP